MSALRETALRLTFTKRPYEGQGRYKSPTESVLQTFEIPLSDFVDSNPAFDPALLRQICYRFDGTKSAVILLDRVGFARVHHRIFSVACRSPATRLLTAGICRAIMIHVYFGVVKTMNEVLLTVFVVLLLMLRVTVKS